MQAFAVCFVGYVARPIGAAIFVTFAVGLVPTYASIRHLGAPFYRSEPTIPSCKPAAGFEGAS